MNFVARRENWWNLGEAQAIAVYRAKVISAVLFLWAGNWTALLNVPRYEATRSPVFHHRGLDRSVGRDPDTAPARGNLYFRFLFVSACLRAPLEGATQGRKAR